MNLEDVNPYAAPKANVEARAAAPCTGVPNAGLVKRFLNLLLDYLAVMGIVFVITLLVVFYEMLDRTEQSQPLSLLDEYINLVLIISFIVYYTICEGLWGRSFGKLVTGTKVVTLSGAPVTFRSAFFRSIIRLLPFEPLSFFGNGFGNGAGVGWHDKWTGTRVVDLRAKPVLTH